MRKNFLLLQAVIAYTLLTGCSVPRYIYSSSKINHAYIQNKGDGELAGYYSSGDNNSADEGSHGADIRAAYAIADRWMINASWFHRKESDKYSADRNDYIVRYKRELTEFGGGYLLPVSSDRTAVFNFTTGIAFGTFHLNDKDYDAAVPGSVGYYHQARIIKPYLQTAFNFFASPAIRFAFVMRSSFVHYGDVKTNYSPEQLIDYHLMVDGRTIGMFEGELNMQANHPKLPWLNLEFALCAASPLNGNYYDVRQNNVSVGLVFAKRKSARVAGK